MSKQLVHELVYDAPLGEVAAMLRDPEFRRSVCTAQGVSEVDVDIDVDGESARVKVDQIQPTKGVPGFAKKIVGEETNVVQDEAWSSPSAATLTVTIPGKPGDISGTITLVEEDGTTTETVDMTIKVSIPLISGKLEGLLSDLLLKALRAEQRVGRDYLS